MKDENMFLLDKTRNHDVIIIRILRSLGNQLLVGSVEDIYSARKGIKWSDLGSEIEFICSPGTWGDVALVVGDRAILFVSLISGKLYEDAWRGHMLIEEIEKDNYVIFPHRELWLNEDVPAEIRAGAREDPRRPYATAIRFDAMDSYLRNLLEMINGGKL